MSEPQQASPQQLVPIPIGERGVKITSFDEAIRFSNTVYNSGLAPKDMRNAQAVFVAMQAGAEIGLPPMASIQSIAVINGRPSLWGDAMLAVCRTSGIFDEAAFLEWDETIEGRGATAFCTVRRLPDSQPITRSFSMADAEAAGLLKKDTPWRTYPQRMRMFRARSWALRDAFGDVLRGMRAAEEERDIIDALPPDPVNSLDDLTAQLTPPPTAAAACAAASVPDPPPEVLSPEPAYQATNPPADPPRQPVDAAPTPKQAENADMLSERIVSAVTAGNISQLSNDLSRCLADGLVARRDHAALLELLDGAKKRLSKV